MRILNWWTVGALAAGAIALSMNRRARRATDASPQDTEALSPNTAERLQQTHARGAFAGIATQAALFPGQDDAGPGGAASDRINPGLPDFFRGA
jgi:hypothetical protein